jgi:hypothetical protein
MRSASPYSPDGLACARSTLTDTRFMGSISAAERSGLVGMAFDILRNDRAHRLGPVEPPAVPGRVIRIPRAVFEAGRLPAPTRRRPRILVMPAGNPTSGDVA